MERRRQGSCRTDSRTPSRGATLRERAERATNKQGAFGPEGLAEAVFGLRQLAPSVGVQVLQLAGLDASVADEVVDLVLLEPNHASELVGRELAFVDQPVEGADRDPQPACRLSGAHPLNLDGGHAEIISTPFDVDWDAMRCCDPRGITLPSYACLR